VAGDYVFVGAGSYTAHGAPVAEYTAIGGESGSVGRFVCVHWRLIHAATDRPHVPQNKPQGCLSYVATGTAVFIAAPVIDVAGIWTTFAIGEYYAVSGTHVVRFRSYRPPCLPVLTVHRGAAQLGPTDRSTYRLLIDLHTTTAGFLVIIGCPFLEITAIEYFAVRGWRPLLLTIHGSARSTHRHDYTYRQNRAWVAPASWGPAPSSWAIPRRSRWWRSGTSTSTSGSWYVHP
jgi:hypothetical protein